jgi:hypothetical protein
MSEYEERMEGKDHEEKMVLAHEPVPGYRAIFYIVLAAAVIYLAVIFLKYTA